MIPDEINIFPLVGREILARSASGMSQYPVKIQDLCLTSALTIEYFIRHEVTLPSKSIYYYIIKAEHSTSLLFHEKTLRFS